MKKIKINNSSLYELSKHYNIPASTIYTWYKNDKNTVFDKIIERRLSDIKKAKKQKIEDLKKTVQEENEKRKYKNNQRAYYFILWSLVLILFLFSL